MALEYSRGEESITVWCSNDYLGISCHPEVKKAVHQAVDQYGVGAVFTIVKFQNIFLNIMILHIYENYFLKLMSVPKIVAFETVHSMTGVFCPLEELCNVVHEFGALTFVVKFMLLVSMGNTVLVLVRKNVSYTKWILYLEPWERHLEIGGYIAGSSLLIDIIRSYTAGFLITTSLPPTILCGTLRSVEILVSEEGRKLRAHHQDSVKYLRKLLQNEGFPVEHTPSHIIRIKINDLLKCTQVSNLLIYQFSPNGWI